MKITFVLTMFLLPSIVFAYPRFGALAGEKCSSCHFQASGGGIRTERGNLFAAENLMMKTFQAEDYSFDPQIKEGIRLGGDLRTMLTYSQENKTSDLLQMEGALYGLFDLSKTIKIYLTIAYNGSNIGYVPLDVDLSDTNGDNVPDKGYGFTKSNGPTFSNSELYGRFSPGLGTYFKAGYFIPDFGLKIPDHRAFTRSALNLGNYGYHVGFESGIEFEELNVSLYLGNQNNGFAEYGSKTKMGILTGKYNLSLNPVTLMMGSSFMSKPDYSATSLFGHIGFLDHFSYLNEMVFIKDKTSGSNKNGKLFIGELSGVIIDGIHFRIQYDYQNVDTSSDLKHTRTTFGIPLYFATGFEFEPMYQVGENRGTQYKSYLLMTHFYF